MAAPRLRLSLAVVALAGLLAACGSGGVVARSSDATAARGGARSDATAVQVIRDWAGALRGGDLRRAAGYFALPSVFANGLDSNGDIPVIVIRSERDAVAVNESLPCGALFISASPHGKYLNVLFRLTARSGLGGDCGSGVGQLARTNFVIKAGRIVEWIRAPDDSAPAAPLTPAPPPSQQGSGRVV